MAQGITVSDSLRDTVTVTELLTTSDSAYSKIAGSALTTYDKEDGDIDGPFALAVAITETTDEAETNLVWFTSSQMLDSSANQMVSGANHDLFLNSLGWMCDRENSVTIHAKSLDTEYLTVPTASANRISVLLIGCIPLLFVGFGVLTVVQRRRK